jgi:hypothetical protein
LANAILAHPDAPLHIENIVFDTQDEEDCNGGEGSEEEEE